MTQWGYDGAPGAADVGTQCARCLRTQPVALTDYPFCVYCGSSLRERLWFAHPPAGAGPKPTVRRVPTPYTGPPSYRGQHPRWGFPPVAARSRALPDPAADLRARQAREKRTLRALALAIVLLLAAGLTYALATAATGWRFLLILQGRSEVLPAEPVERSDIAVVATASAAAGLGIVAVIAVARAIGLLMAAAADQQGLRPPRTLNEVLRDMLTPVWNCYGAARAVIETLRLVHDGRAAPGRTAVRRAAPTPAKASALPRRRWLFATTWLLWTANWMVLLGAAVVTVVALYPGWKGGDEAWQAAAVQWNLALNATAAVTAGFAAASLMVLRSQWRGGNPDRYQKWQVALPQESTARNRSTADDGAPARTAARSADAGRHSRHHRGRHQRRDDVRDLSDGEVADTSRPSLDHADPNPVWA